MYIFYLEKQVRTKLKYFFEKAELRVKVKVKVVVKYHFSNDDHVVAKIQINS